MKIIILESIIYFIFSIYFQFGGHKNCFLKMLFLKYNLLKNLNLPPGNVSKYLSMRSSKLLEVFFLFFCFIYFFILLLFLIFFNSRSHQNFAFTIHDFIPWPPKIFLFQELNEKILIKCTTLRTIYIFFLKTRIFWTSYGFCPDFVLENLEKTTSV